MNKRLENGLLLLAALAFVVFYALGIVGVI